MVAGEDRVRPTRTSPPRRATFELERFAWGAPDRLQVSGRFAGLGDVAPGEPVLVVSGPERTHRLQAVPQSVSGSLEDGTMWSAEFAWQEPPVAFEAATLELRPEIVVELPQPGAKRRWIRGQTVEVRTAGDAASADELPEQPEPERGVEDSGQGRGAERVRLEAELLAVQEANRQLRAEAEQVREELRRALEDLTSERERHAGDVERFGEGLARLRASAAEAEQSAAQQFESALRDARMALEGRDADLEQLRAQLEEATAARAQAESDARTAADALRDHQMGLREARRAADKARTDGENLLKRLDAIRDAVGDGR